MATTSYKLPTSVISNGSGVNGWVNPDNILLVDDAYAVASSPTNVLVVGNFNLNIPQDSSITNFTVQVKGYRGSFNTTLQIYAIDDTSGVEIAYPLAPFQGFSGSNTLYTLPSSLFSTTWTEDQANNIKLKLIADGELHLDAVLINASYVPNVTPVPVPASSGEEVVDEFVEAIRFNLAQSMTAGDLFCFLQSFNLPDGTPIQYADFWGEACLVIDQGIQGLEEQVVITGVTHDYQGTGLVRLDFGNITNRGLKFIYPYDHDINLCRNHDGTAQIVISNSARFYNRFLKKNQIDALVSAPIAVEDEGVEVTDSLHRMNFTGTGVEVINDPSDPLHDVIINIPGTGTSTPVAVTTSSATTGATPAITLQWNHVSSGTNRGLLVQISTGSAQTINSVTYNGIPLTAEISDTLGAVREEQWFLVAPPVGTYPIVITMSAPASITAGAETYNSLNQTTPIGATQNANGSSLAPSLVLNTTVDNSIVVDGLATQVLPISYTVGAGQTENWKITANPNIAQGSSSIELAGTQPDAVTMSWAITQSTNWVLTAVELCGIAGAGPTTDEKVKATSADSVPGYLNQKLQAGANITLTVLNPGANESISIASSGGGGGGGNNLMVDQTPLGTGSTYGLLGGAIGGTTFQVSAGSYVSGTLVVELNGIVQLQGAGDDFVETDPATGTFDFVAPTVAGDVVTVQYQTTAGGIGAQTGIQFEDEGVNLGTAGTVNELDFTGPGVTATRIGDKVTVDIPGGGSSGSGGGGTSQDVIAFDDFVYSANIAAGGASTNNYRLSGNFIWQDASGPDVGYPATTDLNHPGIVHIDGNGVTQEMLGFFDNLESGLSTTDGLLWFGNDFDIQILMQYNGGLGFSFNFDLIGSTSFTRVNLADAGISYDLGAGPVLSGVSLPAIGSWNTIRFHNLGGTITISFNSSTLVTGALTATDDFGIHIYSNGNSSFEVDAVSTRYKTTRASLPIGGGSGGTTVIVTAQEDFAAGDAVGYATNMADSAMKAVWAYKEQTESGVVYNRSYETSLGVCEIGTNKYVVLCENFPPGNSQIKAVVVSLNDDMTWTIGVPSASIQAALGSSDIVKLDTDKFLVASFLDEVNPYIIQTTVCTVVGTTITVGNSDTFSEPSTDNGSQVDLVQLDTDRVAMVVSGTNVGTHSDLFEVTVVGNTPTIGTQYIVDNSPSRVSLITKVDTNKVAIVHGNELYTATVAAGVWTISAPTTLALSVSFTGAGLCGLISTATNNIWIVGFASPEVCVLNYDVTGVPSLTASGSYTDATASLAALTTDGTDVYIATQSSDLSLSGFSRLSIIGPTVNFDTFVGNFTMGDVYAPGSSNPFFQNNLITLTSMNRYCRFGLTSVNILQDEIKIKYHVQGMTPNYIGLTQSSANRGDTVVVTISGVDTNQLGLSPGAMYEPFEGGIIPTIDLSKPWLLQAQSPTDIKVN